MVKKRHKSKARKDGSGIGAATSRKVQRTVGSMCVAVRLDASMKKLWCYVFVKFAEVRFWAY
jgi:hypothetical protein